MTTEQEAVVLEFIGHFRDDWPADLEAPLALLAEDVVYQVIVPVTEPIRGRAAVKAEWEQMMQRVSSQKHDMLAVGSGGRFVFTERVDHALMRGNWADIPLVAVFEVGDDGTITSWREYLDAGSVAAQHGMSLDDLRASLAQE
jgi:limonene-1,2-epoxide hydrolase